MKEFVLPTKRERTWASIRRQNPDAIPWQFDVTSCVARKLQAHFGVQDLFTAMDDHVICVGWNAPTGFVAQSPGPGLYTNEFGAVWRHDALANSVGDWGGLHSYPLTEPSLAGYAFPDGARPGRWDHVPALRAQYPDRFLVAYAPGLFESAWGLCGFENYLAYLAGEPAFVEELTEKLTDYSLGVISQLKGLGLDGVRFGDDWGFQHTLMVRPATWRKIFKQQYRRLFDRARELGLAAMIHSCGNITELLGDYIEIGLEVCHALQPEAMDVRHCQREFGGRLSFWGGLGAQSTLPNGTPEDVRREVRARLDLFRAGGYILAPAGAISTETPVANVLAILEVAREQLSGISG
jgi:uroporphyrinogen decarboxylase